MTRQEFLKICGILGIGLPIGASFSACKKNNFKGKVIIVGAGAGGLCAGYFLDQCGIEFEILEASSTYGGRVKTNHDFADFPIPLGGEWLHVETGVFSEIINDESVNVNVPTVGYDPSSDTALHDGQSIPFADAGFDIDRKFINGTWLTFLEQYILPSVQNKIIYNTVVSDVDYSGSMVGLTTSNGAFSADKAIIAAPLKILQNGVISFTPTLPNYKQEAISNARIWDGFKAFIEFSEKFYDTVIGFDISPSTAGQKLYYDAAYGQNTSMNVLGLFSVGAGAQQYIGLSDDDLRDQMLSELDELYNGQASTHYIKHISQNWNAEPHIGGAYVIDDEDWRLMRDLGKSVDDKIYFAGDAYSDGEDWSSVHTAATSAKRAVEELL